MSSIYGKIYVYEYLGFRLIGLTVSWALFASPRSRTRAICYTALLSHLEGAIINSTATSDRLFLEIPRSGVFHVMQLKYSDSEETPTHQTKWNLEVKLFSPLIKTSNIYKNREAQRVKGRGS